MHRHPGRRSTPILAAQRIDAEQREWIDEAERHPRLIARIDTLIADTETQTDDRYDPDPDRTRLHRPCARRPAITITAVAARAGVARSTIYRNLERRTVIENHQATPETNINTTVALAA